jgi:transposase
LATDISNHIVVSARVSPFKKHDCTFIPEHTKDLAGMDIFRMVLDKGYEGENIHEHLRSHLGCETIIPVRKSRGNRGFSQHGFYRRQMLRLLVPGSDYQRTYNQRPQVECTNFMIKTHTGSHILARNERSKINVGIAKVLAHNCKIVCEHDMDWKLKV